MSLLSTTISRSAEAVPWTPEITLPGFGDLLPFLAVGLTSIVCFSLWLLAVSRHLARHKIAALR